MNVLLINHYAGSPTHGMEYRPFYMAREWVRMGHQVTIVGASQSHLRSTQPEISSNFTEKSIEGIRYVWLKTPSYQGNGIGRVLNMLFFIIQLFKFSNTFAEDYKLDVVIASSTYPLDIYPARFIANKSKAKLIYEVHDLWPLSPMELGGMSPWHPFIMVMQMAENYAYRHCNRVVSMLPKAAGHMCEHGMSPSKFSFVPNGIDVYEWGKFQEELPEQYKRTICDLRTSGQFIVGYAGSHGLSNALQYLLEAASELNERSISIVLVGQGPEKERLQQKAAKLGLDNVHFFPAIPKTMMPALLSLMDILYIGWNEIPIYRFGICPNKLFDYMMAGKPVIHSVDAGNDLVIESGCGISVPPEDPKAIADAILNLKSLSPMERETMGLNGKRFVLANHDYRILAKRFIDIINE
ncbi:glycosyltransferase family 4 protein [Sporomusa sphaeroides]|uniref:glycosyltransferase family 4 protein n=1 Tax=Sporomusa sphaeroides TaxID=47679 RepID=UPI003DA0F863